MNEQKPYISAIIANYFEEASIVEFHERLSKVLRDYGKPFEIIYTNDGSKDRTFTLLKEIFSSSSCVTCVQDLTRNSGQAAAITAGLTHARGDVYLFLDSDLQLLPEEIPKLLSSLDHGVEFVTGVRAVRVGGVSRKVASGLANRILRRFSNSPFSDYGCTFKIIKSYLVQPFAFGEHKLLNFLDVARATNSIEEVLVTHYPRKHGRSGWTFSKLFDLFMDNILAGNNRIFQQLGLIAALGCFFLLFRVLFSFVYDVEIFGVITHGFIVNILVITSLLQVSFVAILGEYVIRSYKMQRRVPGYIVRDILKRD